MTWSDLLVSLHGTESGGHSGRIPADSCPGWTEHRMVTCPLAVVGCPPSTPPLCWYRQNWGQLGDVPHIALVLQGEADPNPGSQKSILIGPEHVLTAQHPGFSGGQVSWRRKLFFVRSQKLSWRSSPFSRGQRALGAAGSHLVPKSGGGLEVRQTWAEGRVQRWNTSFLDTPLRC